jgi:hypothetical protein
LCIEPTAEYRLSLVGIKEPGVFGLMAPVLDSKTGHLRMAQA